MSGHRAAAPLRGLTVIDLTQQLPGPYATFLLASLGARVIKIEPPAGDVARSIDPAMFSNVNAGKQSVVLDLKQEDGRAALHRLVASSDAFVEGFRPGVAARLAADHETIAAVRPDIVYCSLSGFGTSGPYRLLPGHDLNYLGVAGAAPLDGTIPEGPDQIGVPTVDLASGTVAALSIVAALLRRQRVGGGAFLDVAMLDSAVAWAAVKPSPPQDAAAEPAYRVVRCSDGKSVSVAVLEDKFWRNLCDALKWDDWVDEPSLATHHQRRERGREIRMRLEQTLAARPRDEWLSLLWAADVPVAPAHAPVDVADDPQVQARGLFVRDQHGSVRPLSPLPSAVRAEPLAPVPALGEHTGAVVGAASAARGERL